MISADYKARFKLAADTQKWAVTMTKVRIRQAVKETPYPHWHLLTFAGPDGKEARGVVDLIAVRKDHSTPPEGLKRGDSFQIILIQVKGGSAARPTREDGARLRRVALLHNAQGVLLASWKKGKAANFFTLSQEPQAEEDWVAVPDLKGFLNRTV